MCSPSVGLASLLLELDPLLKLKDAGLLVRAYLLLCLCLLVRAYLQQRAGHAARW